MDGKLETFQQQVDGMGALHDKIDNDQKGMRASTNSMQKALAMAETTRRSFPAGASNDADITILRINTYNMVDHEALLASLRTIGDSAGIAQKDYTLKGAMGLSRRFILAFTGQDKDTVTRRATKTYLSLRSDDGLWEQVTVIRPSGGEEVAYISPDKRYSTIQRELGCNTLDAVLKEHDNTITFKIVRKKVRDRHQ